MYYKIVDEFPFKHKFFCFFVLTNNNYDYNSI